MCDAQGVWHSPSALLLAASGTQRVLLAQILQKGFDCPGGFHSISETGISDAAFLECSEKIYTEVYAEVYLHTVMSKTM